MKESFLKKRCGIPAALLLVLLVPLLSGAAVAWYSFANSSSGTTVEESLSTDSETEFAATMYPGDTNTWYFNIVNSADVKYAITAELTTFDKPNGVSVASFIVSYPDGGETANKANDLTDEDHKTTFTISGKQTIRCTMTITATEDASPGDVYVALKLSRGAP